MDWTSLAFVKQILYEFQIKCKDLDAQSNNSIFGHSVWHGMVRSPHEAVI